MTARTRAVLVLFALSGMCALIYQMLWTRWLGLVVGNFATATATVITSFMAGLALGNWLIGKSAAARSPAAALKLYAVLEAGLTVLAFLSPFLLSSTSPWFGALADASGNALVRALFCFLVLIPPTMLMGGTLPALVQTLSAAAPRALGPLYALNTLGGAAGPVLAAFVLMPSLGMRATLLCAAAVNAIVAAGAWYLASRPPEAADPGAAPPPPAGPAPAEPAGHPGWLPYALAATSGFLALGMEIALTRAFTLIITGGSVYGFAIILTSYLLGIALGAVLVRRWPPASARRCLTAFAVSQLVVWLFSLTTPFWDLLPPLLVRFWWAEVIPFGVLMGFNFAVILGLTLALTTAFGYALPVLAGALPSSNSATVGRLFAANTLGAVLGAPATAFVLMRLFGMGFALLALGAAALVAAAAAAAAASEPRQRLAVLVPVPFLLALPFMLPRPDPSVMNAGMYNRPHGFRPSREKGNATPMEAAYRLGKIVYQKDSLTARIAVRMVSEAQMSFVVNGKPDGSTSLVDMYTQILMAHLPALAHPDPKRVLVIGLGTGTTTGCLTLHPGIEEIHVAEIEPAQVDVARWFAKHNYNAVNNTRVTIHLDDARHFLMTDKTKYDVIVSEPSNLWVSGMVNLFTREFYEAARNHLAPNGVFFQWIHYYRVTGEDVKGMLSTYRSVFPDSTYWIHDYGDAFLMATTGEISLDLDRWEERLSAPLLARDLARIQIDPPMDVLGFFLWGPKDVDAYAGNAPVCTDDFPYLEFTTPRIRYLQRDVQILRTGMQVFGPLEPMPISTESARRRVQIGDLAMSHGGLARARAEYRRALELDPGSAAVRKKLAMLDSIAASSHLSPRHGPHPGTRPDAREGTVPASP